MISVSILLATLVVAFSNGANANFKGVASLYGSGSTTYQAAVRWATFTTAAGCITALVLAKHLLIAFSGRGLVPDQLASQPLFLLSVAIGAAVTGGIATALGFPVSTTHALVGALVGAGLTANPAGVAWPHLWSTFAKPLTLGPLIALLVGSGVYKLVSLFGILDHQRSRAVDVFHFLSSGAVCYSRGLNDAPKMAALLVAIPSLGGTWGIGLVTAAMALGGLISAARVADTLAHKITDMTPPQGLVANLSTAVLTISGSLYGLPLSTTHVSVGALLGIGVATQQARWKTAIPVLLAWLITLPCAALSASVAYGLITAVSP